MSGCGLRLCSKSPMKRVMIIGGAGSGKSTLAIKLGELTGLPVIHIDPMYWKPGWILRDADETREMVLEATARGSWIFEGNNTSTFPERIARADTLIFLDISTALRLWRVLYRTAKSYGHSRPDMQTDCPERVNLAYWHFLKWVVGYSKRKQGGRVAAMDLLRGAPATIEAVHLRSRRQVAAYLNEIAVRIRLRET